MPPRPDNSISPPQSGTIAATGGNYRWIIEEL